MPNITERQWTALRQRKQCWHCENNKVSLDTGCNDCLSDTVLFEKTEGILGEFKPNFERGLHCMRLDYRGTYDTT